MRQIFILFMVLSAVVALAQSPTVAQRKIAAEKVYDLYSSYTGLANLKNISAGTTDPKVMQFRSLFAPGAMVYDEITPPDTTLWDMTKPNRRSIDNYLAAVRATYHSGLSGTFGHASISFDSLNKRIVRIVFERKVNATSTKGYQLSNQDTMVMVIKMADDYSSAAISSIDMVGGQIKCVGCPAIATAMVPAPKLAPAGATDPKVTPPPTPDPVVTPTPKPAPGEEIHAAVVPPKPPKEKPEPKPKPAPVAKPVKAKCPDDDDCDGVSNLVDNCPDVAGPASNHGCPVSGVEVGLSINIGGGAGIPGVGSAPDPSQYTGYNPSSGVLQPGYQTSTGGGFNASLDLDLFFGQKKNVGMSIGFNFLQNFISATVSNFGVSYQEKDGTNEKYQRILSADNYTEKVTFTNISIPILFKYQTSPAKKLGFNLEVGPVLSVSAAASGTASADINYEAIYSNPNRVYTRQAISDESGNNPTKVADQFQKLYNAGFYVGLDQHASGSTSSVKYNFGFGGLLRVGGVYRISHSVSFLFGVYMALIDNGHTASAYAPVTAASDFKSVSQPVVFQSFLNGTGAAVTTQVGANVGIQFRFGKKEKSK